MSSKLLRYSEFQPSSSPSPEERGMQNRNGFGNSEKPSGVVAADRAMLRSLPLCGVPLHLSPPESPSPFFGVRGIYFFTQRTHYGSSRDQISAIAINLLLFPLLLLLVPLLRLAWANQMGCMARVSGASSDQITPHRKLGHIR